MTPSESHRLFNEVFYGDIFFGVCCLASWVGLEMLNKYEFDHRTDGGVVKFNSYGASRLHGIKAGLLRMVRKFTGAIFVLLGVFVLIGFVAGANHSPGKSTDSGDAATHQERSGKKSSHKSSSHSSDAAQEDSGSR
ncbi:MAG: hypothetical protein P4M01_12330 [Acidobacteriota bacterium]|nr:hypothetical protein [Acidobacteriota bacterium]